VRGLCYAYVEFFRNVPVLLQLLMWYLMFTEVLPMASEAWQAGPFFLSKGGLNFPIPVWAAGTCGHAMGHGRPALMAWLYRRWAYHNSSHGQTAQHVLGTCGHRGGSGCWAGSPAVPPRTEHAPKGEFAIEDGGALTPEFMAVLLGLTVYTAAFVAEVVRAGIQSVSRGQSEAAAALGLSKGQRCGW
jgi:general L-amino acid transport system permease protein